MHDELTGLVYNRARMLQTVLYRFMQRDPKQYVDGMSLYQYERSRLIKIVDPSGLQAFELNRAFNGGPGATDVVKANCNCYSHTFVYTAEKVTVPIVGFHGEDLGTADHWILKHTYSWGNAAGLTTWHKDQPEDIAAANEAIRIKYMGWQEGPDDPRYDQYIDRAYAVLAARPDQNHWNLILVNNCKNAAGDLESEAQIEWDEDILKKPRPPIIIPPGLWPPGGL